jgi:hypothetical protein
MEPFNLICSTCYPLINFELFTLKINCTSLAICEPYNIEAADSLDVLANSHSASDENVSSLNEMAVSCQRAHETTFCASWRAVDVAGAS